MMVAESKPEESVAEVEEPSRGRNSKLLMTLRGAGVDCAEEEEEEDEVPYGKGSFDKFSSWLANASDDESETTHDASDHQLADVSSGSDDELRAREGLATSSLKSQPEALQSLGGPLQEEPGSGLVDLDPAEGRRRGNELLSLLTAAPSQSPALPPPPPPRATPPPAAAAGAGPAQEQPPAPAATRCLASSGPVPCGQHAAAVSEAASRAFGVDLAEVAPTASGYAVSLRGHGAAELRRGGRAQLDALACSLWPLLATYALGMESHAPEADGVAWLTLWCLGDVAGSSQTLCWDFARTGFCPRAGRCRWYHTATPTYTISIKLAAVAR